jgi:MoaA/NifB/PqqE/SkfB family radical SAM enzyme
MRASDEAFERMDANLAGVRESGIDFGFIFTLTQFNVNELDWAARYAAEQGAKLFQIHPLEEVGRAADLLPASRPDETESAFAFLEARRIQEEYKHCFFVQLDIFHRDLIMQFPDRFYADNAPQDTTLLARCVTPLVVEAEGEVVPLGYGFARQYALGNLLQAPLRRLAPEWIESRYAGFRRLCQTVYSEACRPSEFPFLNWYEMVELRSQA